MIILIFSVQNLSEAISENVSSKLSSLLNISNGHPLSPVDQEREVLRVRTLVKDRFKELAIFGSWVVLIQHLYQWLWPKYTPHEVKHRYIPKMAMLERRCMFQNIILGIYVRFRGVVFVKLSCMSSTFSCLPPTKFKGLQLSIVKKPSTKLISDNSWGRFCRHRRSRASFFWYFLSQTLRTRRECGKANLPVPFFAKCGLKMAVILMCPNDLLSCESWRRKKIQS